MSALRKLCVLLMVVAVVASCTPRQPTVAPTMASTPIPPKPTETPIPQVFTWADSSAMLTAVPCCTATVDKNTRWLLDQMFDGLVEYKPGTSEIIPNLAESWEISADGLNWTFHLRQGVTFSDGKPLTAAEVKTSLDQAMAPDSKVLLRIGGIKEISTPNPTTVVVTTNKPNSALLHGLQEVGGLVQAPNSTSDKPIGTGPYLLTEWNRGEKVVLVRRTNYWGNLPALEKLIYLRRPEATTRVIMLMSGEADLVAKLLPEDVAELQKRSDITALTPSSSMQIGIRLNTRVPPYDNPLVRQALNYAIDKRVILNNLLLGAGYLPDGIAGHGVWGTLVEEWYPFNLEKAGQLLAQAGLVKTDNKWLYNRQPLVFRLYAPEGRYQKDRIVAEYVAAELKKFGVAVQLEIAPWTIWAAANKDKLIKGEADGGLNGFSLQHPVVNWANDLSCGSAKSSMTGYCNPTVDTLVLKAGATFDENEQRKIYEEAQRLLIDDTPYLLLYGQNPIWGVRSRVQGLMFTPNEIPVTDKTTIN